MITCLTHLSSLFHFYSLLFHFYTPVKTSQNLWFSIIFRGYRNRTLGWNEFPFKRQSHKMVEHTQTIRPLLSTILSVWTFCQVGASRVNTTKLSMYDGKLLVDWLDITNDNYLMPILIHYFLLKNKCLK